MNVPLIGFAVSRIGYAAAAIVAPGPTASVWLGKEVERGGARVAARALMARDAALAAGLAEASLSGRATRPWLAALVASDLADIASTLADRDRLPKNAAPGTVAVAGIAAGIGAALFATADE